MKRKINFFNLAIICLVPILLASNIYTIIDRNKNYIKRKDIYDNAYYYSIPASFLNKIMPDKVFYYKDRKLVIDNYLDIDRNTFDNSKIQKEMDGTTRYEDDNYIAIQGIDVSSHNGIIDWQEVRDDGVEFAYIRLGYRGYSEGLLNIDKQFTANITNAKQAGLKTGIYFFSQAISKEEAIEEARFVIENLKDCETDLPIAFDFEEIEDENNRTKYLTKEEISDITEAFIKTMEHDGYTCSIYGNRNRLLGFIDLTRFKDYPIWLASYTDTIYFPYEFFMWQYSEKGIINGINNFVDRNLMFVKK